MENATGYVVQYSTSSRFSNPTEVSSSSTTCQLSLDYSTWYYWRVKATNGNVSGGYSASRKFRTKSAKFGMPDDGILAGDQEFIVTPNPAVDMIELTFYVDEDGRVDVKVYDINGKNVLTVQDGFLGEGEHSVRADVSGLTNGVYMIVLKMGDVVLPRKIVILR